MKTLDGIKKLNAVKKADGELLIEAIDLKELKGAKERDLAEAFLTAIEGIPEKDEQFIPEELAELYNKLAEETVPLEEEKEVAKPAAKPAKKSEVKATAKPAAKAAKKPEAKSADKKSEVKTKPEAAKKEASKADSKKPAAKVEAKKAEVKAEAKASVKTEKNTSDSVRILHLIVDHPEKTLMDIKNLCAKHDLKLSDTTINIRYYLTQAILRYQKIRR